MPFVLSPIKEGYYSYLDLNEMYLDEIKEIQKHISFSNEIESGISKYQNDMSNLM